MSTETVRYARVLVYAPGKTWWAEVPEAEVIGNLGAGGLHYAVVVSKRLLFALVFGVGAPIAISVLTMQLIPFVLAVAIFVLAMMGGGVAGWLVGASVERKGIHDGRIWCVRSTYGEGKRTVAPMRYEAVTVQIQKDTLEAILGEELADGQVPQVVSSNGSKPSELYVWRPDWNAKSFYEDWSMKDWHAELKGGTDVWAKVQIGAFAVTAVALLVISFVAFMAQTSHDPPADIAAQEARLD